MKFTQKTPDQHPLKWSDTELAYMVSRLTTPDGKVRNLATIYHLMGYSGRNPTEAFKKRVEKLRSAL